MHKPRPKPRKISRSSAHIKQNEIVHAHKCLHDFIVTEWMSNHQLGFLDVAVILSRELKNLLECGEEVKDPNDPQR